MRPGCGERAGRGRATARIRSAVEAPEVVERVTVRVVRGSGEGDVLTRRGRPVGGSERHGRGMVRNRYRRAPRLASARQVHNGDAGRVRAGCAERAGEEVRRGAGARATV